MDTNANATNTKRYKLLTGTHTTLDGTTYKQGDDNVYLTDKEAATLGPKRVEGPLSGEGSTPKPAANVAPPLPSADYSELLSMSVPDIEREIVKISDPAVLENIRLAEVAGKQRTGLFKVLSARKEELES